MKKMVFCNIAWMKNYQGTTDDDKPSNGGSYVDENSDGAESCNFLPYNHNCYGYVAYPGQNLNLNRIDNTMGNNISAIEGVTIIWVANRKIVGWYENAKMYRQMQEFLDNVLGENKDWWGYNFKASEKDVYLVPVAIRDFNIPSAAKAGTGKGMGQSNIWYADSDYAREEFVPKVDDYLNKIRDKCIRPFINPEELTKVAKPSDLTYEQFFQKACDLSDEGENLKAIEIFNLLRTQVKIPAESCRLKYFHGWTLSRMLLYDEAIEFYKQCLYDFKSLNEDEMPENFLITDCMWDLANLYVNTRQFYLATELYNQLFDIEEELDLKCDILIELMYIASKEENWKGLREAIKKYDSLQTKIRYEDVEYYRSLSKKSKS